MFVIYGKCVHICLSDVYMEAYLVNIQTFFWTRIMYGIRVAMFSNITTQKNKTEMK